MPMLIERCVMCLYEVLEAFPTAKSIFEVCSLVSGTRPKAFGNHRER